MSRWQVERRLPELEERVGHVKELGFLQCRLQLDVKCTRVSDVLQRVQSMRVFEWPFLKHEWDKD